MTIFSRPRWASDLPASERKVALDAALIKLAEICADNPSWSDRTVTERTTSNYATFVWANSQVAFDLPNWVQKTTFEIRSMFLFKVAAVYASPKMTFRELSILCSLHPHTISTLARRGVMPPPTAIQVEKVCGPRILPRQLLNPGHFEVAAA